MNDISRKETLTRKLRQIGDVRCVNCTKLLALLATDGIEKSCFCLNCARVEPPSSEAPK